MKAHVWPQSSHIPWAELCRDETCKAHGLKALASSQCKLCCSLLLWHNFFRESVWARLHVLSNLLRQLGVKGTCTRFVHIAFFQKRSPWRVPSLLHWVHRSIINFQLVIPVWQWCRSEAVFRSVLGLTQRAAPTQPLAPASGRHSPWMWEVAAQLYRLPQ